jgi:eukaryotic-like serine/threonine-protein kinase
MKSIHTPGTLIGGRYRLVDLAGRGGMAEVWKAELLGVEGFKRPVAVKRILRHLVSSKEHRAMFVAEAQLTALLDHPNVVQVYDFGEDAQGLFIAMEWVEGLSLKELATLLARKQIIPSCALMAAIGIEILRGLEAAHENVATDGSGPLPIIHRDVSPSNVLVSARGVVKLADFGLARAVNRAVVGGVTPAGIVKGKLAYMAPEVLRGKPASPQSDLFSTGVLLWEMMAGRRLHGDASDQEIVMSLMRGGRPESLGKYRPDAPAPLAFAIDTALETDPARRFATASEFARALSDVLRTVPERTDTSRLAREASSALAEWRKLNGRPADPPPGHTGHSVEIEIEATGAVSTKEVIAPSDVIPAAWLEPDGGPEGQGDKR